MSSAAYLLIIGERSGLAWVLTNQRMAFPAGRAHDVKKLSRGDRLFVYTTRGCFHNPTRDRGRIIGMARVTGKVETRVEPLIIGERSFPFDCGIELPNAAPYGEGADLARLIPQLETFSNKTSWATSLRRPLVPLHELDVAVLSQLLRPVLQPLDQVLEQYL